MDIPSTPSAPAAVPSSTPTATPKSSPTAPTSASGGSAPVAPRGLPTAQGSSAVDAAPVEGTAAPTEAQKQARKYKIKVDGVEEEIDLDSLKDDDIVKAKQWERAAQKRMQESAEVKKQFRSFVEAFQADPFKASQEFKDVFGDNFDLMKMAEDRLIQDFQDKSLPPEQKQLKDLQRELDGERKRVQEFESRQKAEMERREEAQVRAQLEQNFGQALASSDLPKTHETMYMMAEVMRAGLEAGIELSPEQMAGEVQKRITNLHHHVTKSLKGEALIKHLGNDVVKEVLNYSLAKARGPSKAVVPAVQKQVTSDEETRARETKNPNAFKDFWRGK